MTATSTVIVGGGFGGIAAANTLRGLLPAAHSITVIDEAADFHVGAGKTWIMLGDRTYAQISRPRQQLLAAGVRLLQASVTGFDFAKRTVATGGASLSWDHLVIGLGATLNLTAVPGLAEAAQTFYTVEGAQRLQPMLESFAGGDIVFLIPSVPFKCPPAPYEAAMLLQHRLARRGLADKVRLAIYTAEGAPMATAGPEMGRYICQELAQRGISFHSQKKARRVEGPARRIVFDDGSEAHYDLLIAVPPHEAPAVVRDAGLLSPSGWIPVDPATLRVKSPVASGQVYAVGDITAVPLPGRYKPDVPLSLPKAGVFAESHGRAVAHQIAAAALGATPQETFDGKGYCYLELGAGRAVKAEGSFFELPHPVMQKQMPGEAQYRDKIDWVARLLGA